MDSGAGRTSEAGLTSEAGQVGGESVARAIEALKEYDDACDDALTAKYGLQQAIAARLPLRSPVRAHIEAYVREILRTDAKCD
jgi:hypothetical protein